MNRETCVAASLLLALAPSLAAQPAPVDPAQAQANIWNIGPVGLSGLVDGGYSVNFGHPASRTNQLRNFDAKADQFSLNMVKLTLEHPAEPVGFRVDLGFGRAFETVHTAERDLSVMRNIEQAYVSMKSKKAGGFQVDFGKFVTSAGAEVIETSGNWNYSRSLLFALAVPYYHFGIRTSMPLHKNFTAGVQLVNGWNNVEDNNSGKTIGLTGSFTSSKVTWSHSYYSGPEKTDTNKGHRYIYDTVLLLAPNPKTGIYLNFDYGAEKRIADGSDRWIGVAGAMRFAPNGWFALSPRLEWFNDIDGFTTGTVQKLRELTLTAEFRMREGVFMRPEYRRDWSDTAYFNRGSAVGAHKSQATLLIGIVACLGPRR